MLNERLGAFVQRTSYRARSRLSAVELDSADLGGWHESPRHANYRGLWPRMIFRGLSVGLACGLPRVTAFTENSLSTDIGRPCAVRAARVHTEARFDLLIMTSERLVLDASFSLPPEAVQDLEDPRAAWAGDGAGGPGHSARGVLGRAEPGYPAPDALEGGGGRGEISGSVGPPAAARAACAVDRAVTSESNATDGALLCLAAAAADTAEPGGCGRLGTLLSWQRKEARSSSRHDRLLVELPAKRAEQ